MQWTVIQSQDYLVVLGDDGYHHLLRFHAGAPHELLSLAVHLEAHDSIDLRHRGVISCYEGAIVSTTGNDIVCRQVVEEESPGLFVFPFSLVHLSN